MAIERQLQGALNTVFTELIKERRLENKLSPYTITEQGRADITLQNSKGKPIFGCGKKCMILFLTIIVIFTINTYFHSSLMIFHFFRKTTSFSNGSSVS